MLKMDYTKSEFRKFSNYSLDAKDLPDFEEKLKNDEVNQSYHNFNLSEQVSTELFVPGYGKAVEEKKEFIRQNLPNVIRDNKVISIRKWSYAIAAACVIFLASVFVINQSKSSQSIEDILSSSSLAALNLDHLGTVERGEAVSVENEIVDLYQKGKYALLIDAASDGEESKMLQLLKARSFTHLGEYNEATRLLEELNVDGFPQRDALLWSLVEAELAQKNIGNAKRYLNEIVTSQYPNYKHAKTILTKL